jgi:hypothetical protein
VVDTGSDATPRRRRGPPPTQRTRMLLTLPSELHETLVVMAQDDTRSLSTLIVHALRTYVRVYRFDSRSESSPSALPSEERQSRP